VLDATDLGNIKPLSVYQASELDSPWSRAAPGRFGAHQFFERMKGGTLVYCTWFAGGPAHRGHRGPGRARGSGLVHTGACAGPGRADDERRGRGRPRVIYVVDRGPQLDILQFDGHG
jgi:hypothetical protein